MTHPAIEHDLEPAAYDYAHSRSGGDLPGEDQFDAWYAFYQQEGDNAERYDFEGIFKDDIAFAMETITRTYGEVPGPLVVDWTNTAAGMMTGHEVVDLPDGRRAYFR